MARDIPGTTGNHMVIGDVTAIKITGTALTVAAWVQPDTVTGARSVACKRNDAATAVQYELRINASKVEGFVGNGGGTFDTVVGATTVTTGVWHHVGFVKAGTGALALRAFLDGTRDGTLTSNVTIGQTTQSLRVGRESDADAANFDGRVAELGIWDTSLTDGEMLALAKGVPPPLIRRTNLKGYWPFFGVAFPEADLSGNINNATQTGTINAANHAPVHPFAPVVG